MSPQFHSKYDDDFSTLDNMPKDQRPVSLWQSKCHVTIPSKVRQVIDIHPIELADPAPADLFTDNVVVNDDQVVLPEPVIVNVLATNQDIENVTEVQVPTNLVTTRAGRVSRRPAWQADYSLVAYEVIQDYSCNEPLQQWMDPCDFSASMDPCAFSASSDPDILYLHEAMLGYDKPEFLIAMIDDIEGQTANENWIVVRRSELYQLMHESYLVCGL